MKRVAFGICAFLALTVTAVAEDAAPSGSSGVTAPTPSPAQPDYAFCTVCHGAHGNGNPAINAPKIAGI